MTKKYARINFIILSIIAILGVILSTVSFVIPGTKTKYVGFVNSISVGLDLKGGWSAVYYADLEDIDYPNAAMDNTVSRLNETLTKKYSDVNVYKQGNDKIRVEVPDTANTLNMLKLIGKPLELLICKTQGGEPVMRGKHVKSVDSWYQSGQYGITIEFTSEGRELYSDLTSEMINQKIYYYLGETSGTPFLESDITAVVTDGKTYISGMNSLDAAWEYEIQITSGAFPLELFLQQNNEISATLGQNSLFWILLAGGISLFVLMVFLVFMYRELGLLANFSLIFFLLLMIFFLQAIPGLQLTLPGIAAIILSFGLAVDSNIIVFERMRNEYKLGKRIPTSVKTGFQKSYAAILDANIITIFASVALFLLGAEAIKGFALILMIGSVLSVFCSLIITRYLAKSYLAFNSTNPKRLNLKRGGDVRAIG